jgi:glutamine synthetase
VGPERRWAPGTTRIRERHVSYKAEYIWIDGTEPSARLRSKTKILADGKELPIWGFDGSSTNQAPGSNSDCVLQPVASYPDPIRGGDDVLVMCEVLLPDMTPHATNSRALLRPIAEKFAGQEPLFGIEQEYTFFRDGRPLGFPPNGFPAPQAFYYCGVGADEVFGRDVVEAHLEACGSSRWARSARSTCRTSCGWPAGCCTAWPRTSACRRRSTRSP